MNVSIYATPDFTWKQMEQIRLGLEANIDVSIYANPELDSEEMKEIRLNLENKKRKQ